MQGGSIAAAALPVVALGGLLYVTSTDGLSLSGRRPEVRLKGRLYQPKSSDALANYGALTCPSPSCNEQ
eukprot:1184324-Prorocentrum_minimum.AAC.1